MCRRTIPTVGWRSSQATRRRATQDYRGNEAVAHRGVLFRFAAETRFSWRFVAEWPQAQLRVWSRMNSKIRLRHFEPLAPDTIETPWLEPGTTTKRLSSTVAAL